jgi:ABC-type multidrug transport system fused ATPase/permease subunit
MKTVRSTLRDLLPLFPPSTRRFLITHIATTSSLTLLDVIAMGLLALVITPIVNGQPIRIPLFGEFPASVSPWLVLLACGIILLKSVLAVLFHWIATRRFASYEFEVGKRLFSAYIRSPWEERSKRSVPEITRIADTGISAASSGFLLPIVTLPQNIASIVLIVAVLAVAQPLTAAIALVYLGLVALVINRVVTRHTLQAAQVNLHFTYRVARLMTEMVEALKELTLRNRLGEIAEVIATNRSQAVRARANASFLAVIPRYAFEAALIGGFVIVGLAAYLASDINGALAAVALFAATGLRIVPALVGLQSGVIAATQNTPVVRDVVDDLRRSEDSAGATLLDEEFRPLPEEPRSLVLRDVTFSYPSSPQPVLRGIDVEIPLGSTLGIVGPSGAGKSTLIDILLGLSTPSSGSLSLDGIPLTEVLHAWRDRVGYVPQRVALFDGTIAQNVALTWTDEIDVDRVVDVLDRAQLGSLVSERREGIHERIGERGVSLSGGQQQRLGIARALYSDPLVLVLDEATSSLDTKTEDDVTQAIRALRGQITMIAVAHRISTIKDFDRIAYLDHGRILGTGTFTELAAALPQFGLQVALAGLGSRPVDPESAGVDI